MAVVTFGFLSVISAIIYGYGSIRAEGRGGEAVSAARQLIDLTRARDLLFSGTGGGPVDDLPDTDWKPIGAPPFQADLFPEGFERRIEVSELSTDSSTPEFRLRGLRVTLRWNEDGVDQTLSLESWVRRP